MLHPAIDSHMSVAEASLAHHLFDISVKELIAAVLPDAQEDDVWRIVSSLERSCASLADMMRLAKRA